jgi:hypothetical protein
MDVVEDRMKQQQMNVYARFITDDAPVEATRSEVAKARRTASRTGNGSVRSPKQGLKKRPGLPK